MKLEFAVFNFSGIYDEESFYREDKGSSFCGKLLGFKDITGTNCMCDDVARDEIITRISKEYVDDTYSFAKGIHFIDSGNYHYMSAIMLSMVKEPFSLVILDHHPDMQAPMFGGILSCGGWVLEVLDCNEYVRDVHVIGADRGLIDKLDKRDIERVHFYDREDVVMEDGSIVLPATENPVYYSLDKDVIKRENIVTNWDQGEMSDKEVLDFTKELFEKRVVIGADICGECAPEQEDVDIQKAIAQNDSFNNEIVGIIAERYTIH